MNLPHTTLNRYYPKLCKWTKWFRETFDSAFALKHSILTTIINNCIVRKWIYMVWQKYIMNTTQSVKACTNWFLWIRLLASCGFQHSISRHYGCPTVNLKDCFCQKKYKTSIIVSYKHEFLVPVIKPKNVALSNNIQHILKFVIFNKFSLGGQRVYLQSICLCVSNNDKCMHNSTVFL